VLTLINQRENMARRTEVSHNMPEETSLLGTADATFIFANSSDTTLTDLYSFLCKQLRASKRLPIKFLADPTQGVCEKDGTIVFSNARSWTTIPVNIEFTEPALYYCEYEILSRKRVKFIMFSFINKEKVNRATSVKGNRFYLNDIAEKGSKISIYIDYRSQEEMHMFIDDVYALSQPCACLPVIPVISITGIDNIVQLNPDTFLAIPRFYSRHILPRWLSCFKK
jgi:hypothetical protein